MISRRTWVVARTDLRQLLASRDYLIPMAILASLFFVFIPLLLLTAISGTTGNDLVGKIGDVLGSLPVAVQDNIRGDTPQARASYTFAVYLLAPVAIVVPLSISAAVGANTIVGERERGTGEFLAHAPVSEREIFAGKLLASLVPGIAATLAGFAVYSLIVNLIVGPELGGWFFPTVGWWLLIGWVMPPFIALALAVIVWASARVRTAAAAQQAATLVSLPMIVATYGITSGLLVDPTVAALLVGAAAWAVAGLGLAAGGRSLRRERLLGVGMG